MKVERKRRGTSSTEVLRVVSEALLWGATEIRIDRDKFVLEMRAAPPREPTSTLEGLLKSATVTQARITNNAARDFQDVMELCGKKGMHLTHAFVRSRKDLFKWAGLRPAARLWGVIVEENDGVPDGSVLFGISKVPLGGIGAVHILLKGDFDGNEG